MLIAERGEGRYLGNIPFLDFPDVMDLLLFLFICFQLLSNLSPSRKRGGVSSFINPVYKKSLSSQSTIWGGQRLSHHTLHPHPPTTLHIRHPTSSAMGYSLWDIRSWRVTQRQRSRWETARDSQAQGFKSTGSGSEQSVGLWHCVFRCIFTTLTPRSSLAV